MFGLWPLSLGAKLAAIGLLIAATNIFTAIKVHDYVATSYQNQILTEKVAVVTREKTIAVLDTQTLNKALKEQQDRLQREAASREFLNEIIRNRDRTNQPWCELDTGELRLWNDENRGLVGDTANPERSSGVPDAGPGSGREDGKPVEKQAGDSTGPH